MEVTAKDCSLPYLRCGNFLEHIADDDRQIREIATVESNADGHVAKLDQSHANGTEVRHPTSVNTSEGRSEIPYST